MMLLSELRKQLLTKIIQSRFDLSRKYYGNSVEFVGTNIYLKKSNYKQRGVSYMYNIYFCRWANDFIEPYELTLIRFNCYLLRVDYTSNFCFEQVLHMT